MFSSTDMRASALVSWKVRTMPLRATRWAGTPARSSPLNVQRPWSGVSNPVSRLNRVVLPAPLGPIRPVMSPAGISRWSTSTAVRPPKDRCTPSMVSMGSGLATPGSAATPSSGSLRSSGGSGDIELQLLLVAEDPLGAVDHQQHDQDTDEGQGDRTDRVGAEELGQRPGIGEPPHPALEAAEQEPEDDRTEGGTPGRGGPPEDEDREGVEGDLGEEGVRLDRLQRQGEERAAQGSDRPTQHQALHLVREDVLPEAAGRILILTDRGDDTAPGAADQAPQQR